MGGDAPKTVPIEDIDVVAATSHINNEEEVTLYNVVIIAVPHWVTHKACLQCKARVEPLTPPLGRCSKPKCKMLQRFNLCIDHTMEKLLFMHEMDGQKKSFRFTPLVSIWGRLLEMKGLLLLKL